MSRIETEYAGQVIHYAENEDVWRCHALDMEAKTLTALKAKVSKFAADARRVSVPAFKVSGYGAPEPCTVVLLDDGGTAAWVSIRKRSHSIARGKSADVQGREKVSFDALALDTPETRAALDRLSAAQANVRLANAQERQAMAAIPRLTLADLESAGVEREGGRG